MVIADSSVLIHLARIERLDLLRHLYQHVIIPPAVYHETVEEGGERAGAASVRASIEEGWIDVRKVAPSSVLSMLRASLDEGEAEVLAQAVDKSVTLVLIDEKQARQAARALDLPHTGTVGVLMRARHVNLISSLKVELDRLREGGLFWISDTLYLRALDDVGEKPE